MHEWRLFELINTRYKRDQTGEASLEVGDIVFKVDGQLATCIVEIDSAALTVLRNMNEIARTIKALPLSGTGAHPIARPTNRMASGVNAFTLGVGRGTPIHDKVGDYDGSASELDDQPTKMLEDIVDVARRLKSKGIGVFNARVASQELFRSGKMPGCEDNVYSVWTNDHYCPAWQIIHAPL
ncbi:hypothetical protein GGI23_006028 [Coemansia sp. RSA 2559]|nr:hypothetical protein GGI23_006028 [Coemansia sp. RSA 2559]